MQDNNSKSPEILLSIFIFQVNRIADSNSIATLFQFERSLCNDRMVVSCVTRNFTTIFVMDQINLTRFISTDRINICHNTIWGKLHTFNRVGHKIFCNGIKLIKLSIFTDQNLFQSICNPDSVCNLILYALTISGCI